MKKILPLLIFFLLSACASSRHIVRLACPKPPIILRVEVKDGTISGKDLDNAIENHERLWEHIHILEKLGCKTK
jgi:hypothetical protein